MSMFDVKTFGALSSTGQYEKSVSISYDTLEHDPTAEVKVLVQMEPPAILKTTQAILDNYKKFDLILGWNENILHLPNAKKFSFGTCWINFDTFVPKKKKEVSFITSNKNFAPGHQLRQQIWEGLEEADNLNGFKILKHKSPPWIEDRNKMFSTSKYCISVENSQVNNYFSEKIIDCFASKTIPIYWGCPNIGEYFNTDGILIFNTIYELKNILDNLNEEFYDTNIDVINENFEKSKKYWDFHLRIRNIIEEYLK